MRAFDEAFQAMLDSGVTTLARCWRIVRRDGVRFGFTDHDRDLVVDGQLCRAATGLSAGAIDHSTGLSVDNAVALGALDDAALNEADIAAGRFDGADVTHWIVNWANPSQVVTLFTGSIGEIRRGTVGFEAELRGLSERLNRPMGRAILRQCDAVLGDARCGVTLDTSDKRAVATVVSVRGDGLMVVSGLGAFDAGWFEHGSYRWTGGANDGQRHMVKRHEIVDGLHLIGLWAAPSTAISAGDTAEVTVGCDRRASTCKAKFQNFANFRGFPHVPGEDFAISYPVSGDVMDGGSLRNG
ncbi:putative phage protein (TIGR02218 family) [Rubricella aquisinus]|uniref:Putative phage protein (TIGR02218 family) n=1 Tax=Rubricella aquisinus TaxID=2028108 RepID=A0A840WSA1_9RHOB|nr:DUF2163 domain-containing protein [Rubricella aquisinus]MBB5516542.1 putative phage protein (TIGR02218 family) [Rubricella aquisinus]